MKLLITYHEYRPVDMPSLVRMALQLWKDREAAEMEELLTQAHNKGKQRIWIAKEVNETAVGFAIFSLRTDYVEGAKQSPTGYLEGIYVDPNHRKKGIAARFLQLGEAWCKEKGCVQIGSDTWLTDTASRAFHKKAGFWEEEEVVHFLKNIK